MIYSFWRYICFVGKIKASSPTAASFSHLWGNEQEAAERRKPQNNPGSLSATGGSQLPSLRQPKHPAATGQLLRLSPTAGRQSVNFGNTPTGSDVDVVNKNKDSQTDKKKNAILLIFERSSIVHENICFGACHLTITFYEEKDIQRKQK